MKGLIITLVLLPLSWICQGQASSGKTFDTNLYSFAKLPILNWRSDQQINDQPAWEGFLLVKAKLNGIYDITGGLQDQETFNVGQIDVWGTDNRKRFAMDLSQTQVRLWSKRKTEKGDFIGYLEGDFWGGNGHFRLRNAWFDYRFVHIGLDWSVFGDKDIWPNVLDWDGPPSGVWRRAPQIKFYHKDSNQWTYEFALENPGAEFQFNEEVAPEITPTYAVMPDLIAAAKKQFGKHYLRLSTIYRHLSYDYAGDNQSVPGYGAALSGYIQTHATKTNALQFQFVAGKGIASYLASFGGRNYDGVPTGNGEIAAIPVFGSWISYEYWFLSHWHCNLVLGLSDFKTDKITNIEIDEPGYLATDTSVKLNHYYLVLNLMYDPTPGLSFGIEYNLGNRDIQYDGTIYTDQGTLQHIDQSRAAQRVSFGVFFDF
ncbi:hypothetical protein BFP72_01600 [Reichenbachiella sp. 5M10]|uniref:hypothetical protein n=1 Tax=Reichenbachiella sp. 5M10 TaxID=1889772 RepID=UPI000C155848|nr:hypothetical protein [Reichenbachiella sp. 5M10]PIB34215.1 hypothetical protein BFP72_01600 [Reichenbachiella sp. 5M10]